MYATLERRSGPGSTHREGHAPALRLHQIGGPVEMLVRLWPERPADLGAFEVRDDRPLTEPDAAPEVALVLTFSGPISEAVEAAGRRAYLERIAPGLAGHPGSVRVLSLWQPELRRQVVISLATSMESLEEGGRKLDDMPLLPGEDVALLPGPDHVEMFRVQP